MSEKYDDDYKFRYGVKLTIGGGLGIAGFIALQYLIGDDYDLGWLFMLLWGVGLFFILRAWYLILFK